MNHTANTPSFSIKQGTSMEYVEKIITEQYDENDTQKQNTNTKDNMNRNGHPTFSMKVTSGSVEDVM